MKIKNNATLLSDLQPGKPAFVSALHMDGLLYRRLMDLGIVTGTKIKAIFEGPSGDPVVYRFRNSHVAIRKQDAELVEVSFEPPRGEGAKEPCHTPDRCLGCRPRIHPGGDPFLVALAGNPNTGKSTVFNALTGLRQHVGNWPGKTVSRAEGRWVYNGKPFSLVDLPGTYSLLPVSVEEEIARDYILFEDPDCTLVVTDATCLERNLNLVLQILQITARAVVCVNLMDEAARKGISIDLEKLEDSLGVPVVGTAARSGRGLSALMDKVEGVASGRIDTHPAVVEYDADLESAVDDLMPEIRMIFPHLPNPRWLAVHLLDGGDSRLMEEIIKGMTVTPLEGAVL